VAIVIFTSCSEKKENKEILKNKGKEIVILNNKVAAASNEIALEKIDIKKEIYAFDWIDEETLLVRKRNELKKNTPQEEFGTPQKPLNLYSYNINTGDIKLLIDSDRTITFARISPDGKYIYYEISGEGICEGHIYEIETNKKITIQGIGNLYEGLCRWIDKDKMLLASAEKNSVYIVDLKGNNSKIATIGNNRSLLQLAKGGDNLFFGLDNESLLINDTNSKKTSVFRSEISNFELSSDKTKLVMLSNKKDDKSIISLTDITNMESKKDKLLYEGGKVIGFSWSPDNNRIAYVANVAGTQNIGLFIGDIVTGASIQLVADIRNPFKGVIWSPSGDKMAICAYEEDKNRFTNIVYIVDLK
jgi:TolB protein